MGRPLRIEFEGAFYHITSRGNERRKIFLDDVDKKVFIAILKYYSDKLKAVYHFYGDLGYSHRISLSAKF